MENEKIEGHPLHGKIKAKPEHIIKHGGMYHEGIHKSHSFGMRKSEERLEEGLEDKKLRVHGEKIKY